MAPDPRLNDDPNRRPDSPPTFSTGELFGEAREIAINHEGAIYRLRITRQGKLILNK